MCLSTPEVSFIGDLVCPEINSVVQVYFKVGYVYHRLLDSIKKRTFDVGKPYRQKLKTALLHATVTYSNNPSKVQHLIDHGYNVNAQDSFGTTPLMLAVRRMDAKKIDILLKNNADIFLKDSSGSHALEIAANPLCDYLMYDLKKQKVYIILKKLIDKLSSEFLANKTKTMKFLSNASDLVKIIVVAAGDVKLAEFILKNGYPVDLYESTMTYTALAFAVVFGQTKNVKLLLNYGADVDDVGADRSALFYYVSECEEADENADALKMLLKHSRYMYENLYHLETLLLYGNQNTVRAVLESGVNVTSATFRTAKSLIYMLIRNRNEGVLQLLDEFDVPFDVHEFDHVDRSTLFRALCYRNAKAVEFLLEHGANANFFNVNSEKSLVGCFSGRLSFHFPDIIDPCFAAIVAHLAILAAVDDSRLTVETRNDIESDALFKDYFVLCMKQLEGLKSIEVVGRVTLFKLLAESEGKVAGYARNGEFKAAFDDAMEKICFLEMYYMNTLRRRVAKAMDKVELERKAALTIETLCGLCNDVYHVVVYEIIGYLRRRDLKNLCNIDLVAK